MPRSRSKKVARRETSGLWVESRRASKTRSEEEKLAGRPKHSSRIINARFRDRTEPDISRLATFLARLPTRLVVIWKNRRWIRALSGAMQLLLLSSVVLAQSSEPLARKVDEFGDIQASDLIARLDNLAILLQNEPTSRGFLIVYRERRDMPGLSNRYAHRMRDYLTNTRGIAAERVVTVDGGIAGCLTQELWIVTPGGAPKPRPDAYFDGYQPAAYKFDEHNYSSPDGPDGILYWREPPDELLGYLEAFAIELRKNPKSHGYLIAYRSAGRDRPPVAKAMLKAEGNFLIKKLGVKPLQIKMIDGGTREWRTMELWIARSAKDVPIITSYRYLPRKRRR